MPVRRRLVVLAAAAAALAACSSAGGHAGPTTTTAPLRCAAYERLSRRDLEVLAVLRDPTADWPARRRALIAGNAGAEVAYKALAAQTTGPLHDDAVLAAAFMPKSRDLVTRSASFAAYWSALKRLPGDAAVREAARRIDADAIATCHVVIAHNSPTTTVAP